MWKKYIFKCITFSGAFDILGKAYVIDFLERKFLESVRNNEWRIFLFYSLHATLRLFFIYSIIPWIKNRSLHNSLQ